MRKIGVIIATFNGSKYIKQQLISIINQSVRPSLIVITDGGSSDDTVSICKNILVDKKIAYKILTSRKQLSVTKNFEKGLYFCDCKYIFFSDQDDVWEPKKIAITVQAMEKFNAVLAFTNAHIVDCELKAKNIDLWKSIDYKQKEYIKMYHKNDRFLFDILLQRNIVTGMCMCINHCIKEKLLPFSIYGIHDKWIGLLANSLGNVVAIDEKCVKYRQHGNNVIGADNTLRKSFGHRKSYQANVCKRIGLIKDVLVRLGNKGLGDNYPALIKYKKYLLERYEFLKGNISFFYPITNKNLYKKYELGYKKTICKDYIVRLKHFK